MKNRGFTLVELVAIIAILATIFLLSFPNLVNMTKDNKEKEYKNMVDNLCLSGQSYIYSNLELFPELSIIDEEIIINIDTLMSNGYVEKNIKNPKNNKKVNNSDLKYKVQNDHSLECSYVEE